MRLADRDGAERRGGDPNFLLSDGADRGGGGGVFGLRSPAETRTGGHGRRGEAAKEETARLNA